jgi:hypothetical protein
MTASPLTADELYATVMRTNLPTILVEGATDASVYRYLEQKLSSKVSQRPDILPCSGRKALLEVYDRVHSSSKPPLTSHIGYLADRDMWAFGMVPSDYVKDDIVLTTGYSIENDLFAGSKVERLLEVGVEESQFQSTIKALVHWFAFEVTEFRAGRPYECHHNPRRVVADDQCSLRPEFCFKRGYAKADESLIDEIFAKWPTHLPGKRIFDALAQFLSAPGRRTNKYSKTNLQEICLKLCDTNEHLVTLLESLQKIMDD